MIFCLFQCSARNLGWRNSASYAVGRFIFDRQLICLQTDIQITGKVAEFLSFLISKSILPHQLFSFCFHCVYQPSSMWSCEYFLFPNSVSPDFPHYHIMSDICQTSTALPQPLGLPPLGKNILLLLLWCWYSGLGTDVWNTFPIHCKRWCIKLWEVTGFIQLIHQV